MPGKQGFTKSKMNNNELGMQAYYHPLIEVSSKLENISFPWAVIGSANEAFQGVVIAPKDIDIITSLEGITLISDRLADFEIIPLDFRTDNHIRSWFTVFELFNMRIEVMAEVENYIDGAWRKHKVWETEVVYKKLGACIIPCVSLKYEQQLYVSLNMPERVRQIEKALELKNQF